MTVRAYIGIGSNLEDPVAQVKEALEELAVLPDSLLAARSSLYSSKPMGPVEQPDYVNAVAALDTLLSAPELLAALQRIETLQGRERSGEQWGPRILDLDLLLYGKQVIDSDGLKVPHPGLHERDFVIIPLAEIAGNLKIPGKGMLGTLIKNVENHSLRKLVTG
ncbi:MAG TPA: 2-amino-4-hydroxy-6-hydroxymethyldihydropteridine diphosphokinase [Gammaproteobacteria bacterium]|nr:2-amino-4-hydroxy-6-hydroxymethyldihydropteridine diphosphokinase [Gammaproteobacteria bacterium]